MRDISLRFLASLRLIAVGFAWAAIGAGLVGVFGALIGLYFAGACAVLGHAMGDFVATVGYFTLCGAATGAILGAYLAWFDDTTPQQSVARHRCRLDLPPALRDRLKPVERRPVEPREHSLN